MKVDTFPVDESPFGVRGMAGGIGDWCADAYCREGPAVVDNRVPLVDNAVVLVDNDGVADRVRRPIRGGHWYVIAWYSHLTNRFGEMPSLRYVVGGFRVCRSPAPEHLARTDASTLRK